MLMGRTGVAVHSFNWSQKKQLIELAGFEVSCYIIPI